MPETNMKQLRQIFAHRVIPQFKQPRCCVASCDNATKAMKDYCTEHIDEMDYAQYIHSEMLRREKELTLLDGQWLLSRDSHLIREVCAFLFEQESITSSGLRRKLDIKIEHAEELLRHVAHYGLAELSTKAGRLLATRVE